MDERLRFVRDAQRSHFTMSELCARYGVSRRVGYKWLARYDAEGRGGLADRSHAPKHCPHKIPHEMAELLILERIAHPHWGARKLLAALQRAHPRIRSWPAASTVADLLSRQGLVQKRRRRRASVHPGVVRPVTFAPNDLWTADFKGQFRTGDGKYCYPLTICDLHTRYLLCCRGTLSTQTVSAKPIFERTFREYGLPLAIRTDNGVPFATQAIHGISYLNVWWMRLGIQPQRIRPGNPQENGAHERMHRTLKRQAIKPVRASCTAQQRTSMCSCESTTTNGRTSDSTNKPRARSISIHADHFLSDSRHSSTPRTSMSRRSRPRGRSAFVTGFSISRMRSWTRKSGWRKPTTASGASTSAACY